MIIRDQLISRIGVGVPQAGWDDVIGERIRPVYGGIGHAVLGMCR
jgi:hypothetical protein